MTDREKIIKGLEWCPKTDVCNSNCFYFVESPVTDRKCFEAWQSDAIALLKEQEQIINELENKLRLLEYGDQDILQSGMMPAT